MVILGIDPGTTIVGYGIIEKSRKTKLIDYGVIRTGGEKQEKRLVKINEALAKIIKKYSPTVAGLETLFFSTNKKTALSVAEARGAIILTLAKNKIPIMEFSPNNIKMAVSGYGRSDKAAMEKIISLTFSLKKTGMPDDAFDALAIALRASFEIKSGG